MKRHILPGEEGHSDWFDRLNIFEQQETLRQVEFKRKCWPGLPDGVGTKKNGETYTYPHILPELSEGKLNDKSLYPGIVDKVIGYCTGNNIAIHSEFLNLRSSQACCFNVLFPLRLNLELAKAALEPVLPRVWEVFNIEFEYTGPKGNEATEWLGEPTGGRRGQNRTSIDAAVWWTDGERKLLTFIEWKYTERNYGTCGGYASNGNRQRHLCEGLNAQPSKLSSTCYLTLGRNTRRYWERLADAFIDLSRFSGLKGCPFKGPFYQLMRQHLLAAYCGALENVKQVYVVSVGFRGNQTLHELPADLQAFGSTVEEAWNTCLRGAPPMRHINVEAIAERIKASPQADQHWLAYLNERYGL
jgi:hypothetical protein